MNLLSLRYKRDSLPCFTFNDFKVYNVLSAVAVYKIHLCDKLVSLKAVSQHDVNCKL